MSLLRKMIPDRGVRFSVKLNNGQWTRTFEVISVNGERVRFFMTANGERRESTVRAMSTDEWRRLRQRNRLRRIY